MAIINGTSGSDNINGTQGDDIIFAGAGDDNVNTKKGNDTVYGGDGNDTIRGGPQSGSDTFYGEAGNDSLYGDGGNDLLVGGAGYDYLDGGDGIDTARYYGSIFDYSFYHFSNGSLGVVDSNSARDGADLLVNMEKLVFADATIDLTQNNAPIAKDDTASMSEDDPSKSGNVLSNDFDFEGDTLSATPGTFNGTYGTLVLNANGSYTYTPYASVQALDDGESVQDSFNYTVSDGSLSDTGMLTVTINGANDAPVANDDTASTSEDSSVAGNVLTNDTDVDVEPLTVANPGTYVGAYGTLVLAANGSYTYTPGAAAQGLDTGETAQDVFNYSASDGTATDSATLTITINGANDAPVANDDTASTSEDAAVSGNVLANDTDVDVEPLTVTNPGTYVGAYGTLVLAANGSYTYTPGAAAQGLDTGETAQDVFNYTASDGTASDGATLTVTINGANDAPVANNDTNTTSEDAAVSGNVLTNDTDVDVEPLTVANPGTYVGTYGTLVLNANGSYTYTPGAAAQGLDTGETAQDVFNYSASDGTATGSATLTITVTGANDAPVAVDDTATTDENSPVSGNVLANDTDVDVEPLTVANPGTYVGAYGTLVLAANGSYTFTPGGAAALLNTGQTAQDVFNYVATDGTASDAGTLTVTVTGLSGAPNANDDTATTTEDANVSGNVLTNDTDVENDPLTVTNPGTYAGTYGTLTLNANGSYTYVPNSTADGLAVGESAQDVFSYTASDGSQTDTANLTITVNGTNDAPTIDSGNTDASGAVTELPDGDPNENTATLTDSGSIAFNDLDLSDTHSASFTPQGPFYLGTFSLDPVDQPNDNVAWNFSVSDAALEGLSEGEVRIQNYNVQVADGHGGFANQTVTITITGSGVGVGPQTVWFIDNSAVGSTNVGTAANPYTSIAAFNAAQGSLGGPQPGHTVHLLAGTGTYTEADGINLLDGQILVGDADGAVRPTIVATSGDGIDVAENNNVSGIDIGSTSGAGIDDDGGTVGNLVVTDVGIGGARTGQIVDIDHGGTLNVTLNSAASTGSSGGAIDLDGVGGTFTVSSAVQISGSQTGGGIDVTSSTAAIDLTNGVNISTGGADAINYVGNGGSLTLGGGVTLVTTTGRGLDASGGGTVTVTGSGNTIVSAGGIALNVAGTTIGSDGITFESISATGGTNGIVLQNTGSLAGLTVTGTGAGASGGTITGTTGAGIVATDTQDLNLSSMVISSTGGSAIQATNLRGADTVTGTTISGFGSGGGNTVNAIAISNTNTNLASFTLINSTITGGATGNDGLNVQADGSSSMSIRVANSSFTGLFGDGVQVNGTTLSSGSVNVVVADSNFSNAVVNGSGGVVLTSLGSMTMTAAVERDTFQNVMRPASNLGAITASNGGTATANLTFRDNVISDLPGSRGITFSADAGTSHLAITGNSIDRLGSTARAGLNINLTGTADATAVVTGNMIGQNGNLWTSGNGSANALLLQTLNAATLNALVDGNTISGNTNVELVRARSVNTSVLNATVSNNTLSDTVGAHLEFDASAGGATGGTINLNMFSNILPAAGVGVIRLNEVAAPSDINVTQTSQADLSTQNNNATVTFTGSPDYGQPAPSVPSAPPLPPGALLASAIGTDLVGHILTQGELDSAVSNAIDDWVAAGASADQVAAMRGATVSVASLGGLDLGSTDGSQVLIDDDAAGFGWGSGGGMDLLSVVMHELGHVAGLDDGYSDAARGNLMYGFLAAGDHPADLVAAAADALAHPAPLPQPTDFP